MSERESELDVAERLFREFKKSGMQNATVHLSAVTYEKIYNRCKTVRVSMSAFGTLAFLLLADKVGIDVKDDWIALHRYIYDVESRLKGESDT